MRCTFATLWPCPPLRQQNAYLPQQCTRFHHLHVSLSCLCTACTARNLVVCTRLEPHHAEFRRLGAQLRRRSAPPGARCTQSGPQRSTSGCLSPQSVLLGWLVSRLGVQHLLWAEGRIVHVSCTTECHNAFCGVRGLFSGNGTLNASGNVMFICVQ